MRCSVCDEDTDLISFDQDNNIDVLCKQCRVEIREVNDDMNLDNMSFAPYQTEERKEE